MNLKEQIFLTLLQGYSSPERLGEDQVKHLAMKAERFYQLYQQYSQKNG